jgi:hypothetical protein
MHCRRYSLLTALACASFLLHAPAGQAQTKPEKIHFDTIDGVRLRGMLYQPNRSKAPVVLMLHALGEDSRKKGWSDLAEELQGKGFAVLTFDFRGHGQSTEIIDTDLFWKYGYNLKYVPGAAKKAASLEFKSFGKAYYPVLVNDIAAAKAYLDRKNDGSTCNSGNVILVGAETGGTLGAIWLNSEWHRHRVTMAATGATYFDKSPEGKDVIAAIWLSISPTLGAGRTVNLASTLSIPALQRGTPMVFMHGEGDNKGKDFARHLEKYLKGKDKEKYRYTGAVPVPGKTKLTGAALLQKSLTTSQLITSWVEEVVQEKGSEWVEKEFTKTNFVWLLPGGRPKQATPFERHLNLIWDSYEAFIR